MKISKRRSSMRLLGSCSTSRGRSGRIGASTRETKYGDSLEELNATFESVQFEPHDFIEADDYLVVPLTIHFKGRDGIRLKADTTNLWAFRDGSVVRIVLYQELQQALAAAGLAE